MFEPHEKLIFNQIARDYYGGGYSYMRPRDATLMKLMKLQLIIVRGANTVAIQVTLSKRGKEEFITGVHSRAYRDLGDTSEPVVPDSGDSIFADRVK